MTPKLISSQCSQSVTLQTGRSSSSSRERTNVSNLLRRSDRSEGSDGLLLMISHASSLILEDLSVKKQKNKNKQKKPAGNGMSFAAVPCVTGSLCRRALGFWTTPARRNVAVNVLWLVRICAARSPCVSRINNIVPGVNRTFDSREKFQANPTCPAPGSTGLNLSRYHEFELILQI